MEDDSTVITIEEEPRRLTKSEVLAEARVKALQSRRRTQKLKLENKLQEVKILLGDMDPEHVERTVKLMLDREAELRNKHASFVTQLNETIRSEAKKREHDYTSIKRRLEAVASEVQVLREAITKKRSEASPTLSSVASVSASPSVHPLHRIRKQ